VRQWASEHPPRESTGAIALNDLGMLLEFLKTDPTSNSWFAR
jgi:hypothetical protein